MEKLYLYTRQDFQKKKVLNFSDANFSAGKYKKWLFNIDIETSWRPLVLNDYS